MSRSDSDTDQRNGIYSDTSLIKSHLNRPLKKPLDSSVSGFNASMMASLHISSNESINKSGFNLSTAGLVIGKTPSKTPSKRNIITITPNKSTPLNNLKLNKSGHKMKTPRSPSAPDRFIPNRSAMNNEINHYLLTQSDKNSKENDNDSNSSDKNQASQQTIGEALNFDMTNHRILCFNDKAPIAPEGHANNLKVLYSSSKLPSSCKKSSRFIPSQPERILDAPEILNDYYLQLIDWNNNNMLAVALGRELYLWNAQTGSISNLLQLSEGEYISSVAWVEGSNNLAVGTSAAEIQLWDADKSKRLRRMVGHTARVSSLSWNSYILSSGSRSGAIFHHDVRVSQHHVGSLLGHDQEVCGLKWSPNGQYLASGSNDNTVNVWPKDVTAEKAVYTFNIHQAAVKAIAWSPWKPNLLATGGGTADRFIRIWNVNNGNNLYSVDAKSQVCAILWSKEYQELISGHGYANNELIIWKYPGLTKITELNGHTGRVLGMSMSPDGSTVVSLGADETLRFWECFQIDNEKKKKAEIKAYKDKIGNNPMRNSIR